METQVALATARWGLRIRLAVAVAVFGALLVFGSLSGGVATAQPALEIEAFCEPDSVRPNEAALVTCTVRVTNTGDEPATNLATELAPSPSCALPAQVIPPLIYAYRNGELLPFTSLPVSQELGDLAPGETVETVVVLAVRESGGGPVGGRATVRSLDDASISASGDLCWNVAPGAAAPPTNLSVTKTLLTEPGGPTTDVVEYEITISNVGGAEMTGVSLVDVQLGGAAVLEATPAPSGTDGLGRPTWDLGDLAPGATTTVRAVVGSETGECAFSNDLVVVSATPAGGAKEDYVAFANQAVEVGRCGPFPEEEYCEFFGPGENDRVIAPCDEEVCWAIPADGEWPYPIFECDPDAEYCWFYPPGEGQPFPALCTEEVCWFSFSGEFEDYFVVGCDEEFCEYTSPDGAQTYRDSCDFPVCWSTPPGGGFWEPVFGCGEFGDECWWSPESGGDFVLLPCDLGADLCFAVPPEGALTFAEFDLLGCDEAEGLCWPVPTIEAEQFITSAWPCEEVEDGCWAISPGSAIGVPVECGFEFCWVPLPPDAELPPGWDLPPDFLIPDVCRPGQEPKSGVPGTSVPVVAEPVVSTPAEIVEGTVETLAPQPSASTSPAEVVPSVRVVPIGPRPPDGPEAPGGQEDGRSPPRPDRSRGERPDLLDVLGISQRPSGGPNVTSLPQSGASFEDDGVALWRWLLVAALLGGGLAAIGAGVRLRRRRQL